EESSERGLIAESRLKPKALTNYKAFIVGASDYQDDAVSDLKGVKNDVKALKKRLLEIGFEEKNIAVLLDGGDSASMPTKKIIERRFDEFVADLQEGDNVVVYLSGHGVQKGKGKEAETFFVPMDVDPGSDAKTFATSVSVEKMTDKLAKNEAARFRLVIVDACREKLGKSMSNEVGGAPRIATMIDAPKSVSVLYSCEPDKLSFEDDEADEDGVRHGLFTRGLLDALDVNDNKGDVDNDGKLTFLEFVKYVSERTESLASAQGKKQKPRHRFADESGDFVFLSDLLVDGLTRAEWNKAEKLYQAALKLKAAEKWSEALQKIRDARKINPKRPEYKTTEEDIKTFVKLAGLSGGVGSTGGGTSRGLGWFPFALFGLVGGAACVAWLGWRKFELSRAIIGAFEPRSDVERDARDAKRALRRQRKILDRTRKETRILENIAKTREETRNLEKATEAERKAQEAATANVVGASSSSSGYAPSDVAVAPRPFESTPRSTFAEPVAPVLPPSERG
ncbi:MAG: caspase family protein, partial [Thermoguttaceae bacterium]|nr:caspase family protein [Thermoguttaceae bacterium]